MARLRGSSRPITCGAVLRTVRHAAFYDMPDADFINITLGSLDEPELIKPEAQSNLDSKMHWFGDLDGLPVEPEAASDENRLPVNNRQHPDRDTAEWPPEGK